MVSSTNARIVAALTLCMIACMMILPFGIVHAQQQFPGDEGPPGIVPCGDPGQDPCNACDLLNLSQDVINFGVYFTVFVATVAFIYAGFLYITAQGAPSKISAAHKIFQSVLIGMIIVLASWLIIDAIMSEFLNKKFGPWNDIVCAQGLASSNSSSDRSANPNTAAGDNSIFVGTPDDTTPTLSHATALQQLHDVNVQVTSTSGPGGVQADCAGKGCTSLKGIRKTTIDEVISFRSRCGCDIVVTGGTEKGAGHASGDIAHETGYKIDIDDTPEIDAYIEKNFQPIGNRGGDPIYLSPTGAQYVREDTHWDVLVTGNE